MSRGQYVRNSPATEADKVIAPEADTTSPRAADTRRERRRREDGDLDRMGRMALSIPRDVQDRLDREGKTARWVRDNANRQRSMQDNDWDITPGVEPVSEDRDGTGKLVLMEKFKDWWEDDQRAKSRTLDEKEQAIERGAKVSPDDPRQERTSYVPDGNKFSRQPGA